MKKSILIIAPMAIFSLSFAQSKTAAKTDSIKKEAPKPVPVYQQNKDMVYHITLDLTGQEVSLLTAGPDEWKSIFFSKEYSGFGIEILKAQAQDIRQGIFNQVKAVDKADLDKWKVAQVDSLAKAAHYKNSGHVQQ